MELDGKTYEMQYLTDEETAVINAMRMGGKVEVHFFNSTTTSPDRAACHAHPLACGRQQSAGSGIRCQTQFHAVYREIPAHDRQG